MTTDIPSVNICDIYRLTISNSENFCECATSRNKVCKNKHKFKYTFSNGEEIRTCGISKHRKIAMNKSIDNITVNISKLIYSINHNNDNISNEYKVIAVNVNCFNDHECPLVSNSTPPIIMKYFLKQSLIQNKLSENFVRKTIQTLRKLLKDEEKKLYHCLRIDNEYRLALYHMRFNVSYTPSKKSIQQNNNDVCAICHEKLDASNSSILYECNHAFHNHCIKQWFQNKEAINCPCCRKECDIDKYFMYSRYKPLY